MEFIDTNTAAVRFGQAYRYWPYDTLPPESFLIPGYVLSEDAHAPVTGTGDDLSDIDGLAVAVADWLPQGDAMIWVQSAAGTSPLFSDILLAWRKGHGATTTPVETPGHVFEAADQAKAGMIALMILSGWHGWLVAAQTLDRVEFYAGSVRFHSPDSARRDEARSVLQTFAWQVEED